VQHQSVGQLRISPAQFVLSLLAAGALILSLFTLARPVLANPPDPSGNNGTVKVHEEPGEAEPIVRNEPHVGCAFHFHFFFADAGQEGMYWVQSWPPTGDMTTVMGPKPYGPTDASGEWRTEPLTLPSGHYKLFWQGRNDQNIKHKVFWVECENGGGGESSSLNLVKNDQNGDALGNVEFTLTGVTDPEFSAVATTDADGKLTFTDLVEGTYSLTETANDNGDCDTSGTLTVTVTAAGEVIVTDDDESAGINISAWDTETNTLTVENNCGGGTSGGGELNLVKNDQNGDALGDVEFTLTGVTDPEFSAVATTDVDGTLAFSDLAEGTYTLTETGNDNGDCDTSGTLTVEVSANGEITVTDDDDTSGINITAWDAQTNTLTVENNCGGGGGAGTELNLVKVDQNGDALGSVTFHLSLNESEFFVDETTDANGQLIFSDLGAGTFTLTETANDNGDCDITGALTVEISDAGVITVTDDDDTSGINIKTWDSATNTLTIENNCAGGTTVTPPVRGGTKGSTGGPGGGQLPNTSMPGGDQLPIALLALAVIGSLGVIGGWNVAAVRVRSRRR
jgi:hypothetical protein